MKVQDNIYYLERKIKKYQKNISNFEKKLDHIKKIESSHPNCSILSSKEIEKECLDKCNKIKIYKQYYSTYFKFYYLDNQLKIFDYRKIEIYSNKNNYDFNKSSYQTKTFCTIKDYISCFPESFPKRNYWIKKIEKFIVRNIIKNNYTLNEKSFNYDKIQGYMVFA